MLGETIGQKQIQTHQRHYYYPVPKCKHTHSQLTYANRQRTTRATVLRSPFGRSFSFISVNENPIKWQRAAAGCWCRYTEPSPCLQNSALSRIKIFGGHYEWKLFSAKLFCAQHSFLVCVRARVCVCVEWLCVRADVVVQSWVGFRVRSYTRYTSRERIVLLNWCYFIHSTQFQKSSLVVLELASTYRTSASVSTESTHHFLVKCHFRRVNETVTTNYLASAGSIYIIFSLSHTSSLLNSHTQMNERWRWLQNDDSTLDVSTDVRRKNDSHHNDYIIIIY